MERIKFQTHLPLASASFLNAPSPMPVLSQTRVGLLELLGAGPTLVY